MAPHVQWILHLEETEIEKDYGRVTSFVATKEHVTILHTKYLIHSTMTFSKTYMISNIIRLACGKNKTDHETPLKVITGNNVKI